MLDQAGMFIQQVAEALCSVIGLDMYVLDDSLTRVAGTGRYKDYVGLVLPPGSANHKVLTKGDMVFIPQAKEGPICESCPLRSRCIETATIIHPMRWQGSVVGTIAVGTFDTTRAGCLNSTRADLVRFLERVGDLIAAKLGEEKLVKTIAVLSGQLKTILELVSEGVLVVDGSGRIRLANKIARKILGIRDCPDFLDLEAVFPGNPFVDVLKYGTECLDREVHTNLPRPFNKLITAAVRLDCGDAEGVVILLRPLERARTLPYRTTDNVSANFSFDSIIGASDGLLVAKEIARKAASRDSSILIVGETGTGKEVFARAIHRASSRSNKPFVAVNCAAIPESLLESELFGYEDGAFTGARRGGKPGKLELANGGTLFLDEVGDMPLHLQPKVLRVLESHEVERVGGTRPFPLNIRVIAATNRDLEAMVERGEFRADLFYRLNVIRIDIPPLRDRLEDIPLLVEHFLRRVSQRMGLHEQLQVSPEAMDMLTHYHWPGNVRELANVIEFAANIAEGPMTTSSTLPSPLRSRQHMSGFGNLETLENEAIMRALARFGLSTSGKKLAARELGISLSTLYRRIARMRANMIAKSN